MPRKAPKLTKPKPFDLASRYAADTVDVVITDPADPMARADTGVRITIRSIYSPEAREAATSTRAKLKLVDGKVDAADADFETNLFEQTIAVTVGWSELLENGSPLPCTPENVRRVYSDPRSAWLQKQVQAAYLDLGRFFPKPRTA